jgi:hypothetical protein
MKDNLQNYLISVCVNQFWIRKQIESQPQKVEKININSIASVKQIKKHFKK